MRAISIWCAYSMNLGFTVGMHGCYVLELMKRLNMPVVTTAPHRSGAARCQPEDGHAADRGAAPIA